MTMTPEQARKHAVEMLSDLDAYAPDVIGANNLRQTITGLLDALAAEKRRADEAHAAGFREAVERAAQAVERVPTWIGRTPSGSASGNVCSTVIALSAIRALAPAAPTDAAPVPNGQPARPRHYADCAHDSTAEISVPHMDERCGFVSEVNHVACTLPVGHAGWHRNPPVPAPAVALVATPSPDPGAHLHNCPATAMRCPVCPKSGPQACEQVPAPAETPVRPAFDAEAALEAARDAARSPVGVNPTLTAREVRGLVLRMLDAALAAGRKP